MTRVTGQAGLPCSSLPPRSVAIAVSLGVAVIAGSSAVYGFAKTDACRRANPSRPVPPPQLPPQVDDRFWCQRDSGICTNDRGTCGPECLSAQSIWCAPYKTVDGKPGLLCGLSGDVCFVLTISDHNRRGRENFGECAQRTEPLPPTRPTATDGRVE